jgi:hypothetical protein
MALAASRVKQGAFEDVDLALFSVDQQKLPAIQEMQAPLCRARAWPGDPVIVVDQAGTARSHIISPVILSFPLRSKFSTLMMLRPRAILAQVCSTLITSACSVS